MVKLAKQHKLVDYVYDLTVAYSPMAAPGEKHIFTGFPTGTSFS
jgi:hypothetical protein